MGVIGVVVRLCFIAVFAYTWMENAGVKNVPPKYDHSLQYGGIFRFLTMQNFSISTLINVMLVVGDFVPKGIYF